MRYLEWAQCRGGVVQRLTGAGTREECGLLLRRTEFQFGMVKSLGIDDGDGRTAS